ncbi:MAG TPA: POTRA domain-containing protein [Terriglobales bacterium]|nr:POTRA domain-containing protein [Terriglobales bacterium]
MKFPRLPAVAAAYCLLSVAFAETPKPSSKDFPSSEVKLKSVQVTGTTRYKTEDIIRAANLKLGQSLHDEDLKTMVRLLGESGAFAAVSYTSQFEPDGAKVKLKLRDADRVFPAYFDNVVWFTGRELVEKLHARVPLFDGQLPGIGGLAGEVSEALQALLIEKNVAGQVNYLRPFDEDNPVEAFVFAVSGPTITIRNVEFSGAGQAELPALKAAANSLQGAEYRRPEIRALEDKAFLPIYREHGYLKAVLGDPEPTVVQNDVHDTLVDVLVPVRPGRQYRLSAIKISGNTAFPDATLEAAFHLRAGEVANVLELEKDLAAVHQLYGTRGYMSPSIKGEARADDSRSSLTYYVSIAEGDVYKMGEVVIRGVDSATTTRLASDWTLRSGDTYDSSYPGRFVEQAYKQLGDWHASVHESLDPDSKTVDVTVRFEPPRDGSAFGQP